MGVVVLLLWVWSIDDVVVGVIMSLCCGCGKVLVLWVWSSYGVVVGMIKPWCCFGCGGVIVLL